MTSMNLRIMSLISGQGLIVWEVNLRMGIERGFILEYEVYNFIIYLYAVIIYVMVLATEKEINARRTRPTKKGSFKYTPASALIPTSNYYIYICTVSTRTE